MAKPKPRGGSYLARLREERGLTPREVRAKLRAVGIDLDRSAYHRYEQGQRQCPVRLQWELARIYDVGFLEMLRNTEGLPDDAMMTTQVQTAQEAALLAAFRLLMSEDRAHLLSVVERLGRATTPPNWFREGRYIGPERRKAG